MRTSTSSNSLSRLHQNRIDRTVCECRNKKAEMSCHETKIGAWSHRNENNKRYMYNTRMRHIPYRASTVKKKTRTNKRNTFHFQTHRQQQMDENNSKIYQSVSFHLLYQPFLLQFVQWKYFVLWIHQQTGRMDRLDGFIYFILFSIRCEKNNEMTKAFTCSTFFMCLSIHEFVLFFHLHGSFLTLRVGEKSQFYCSQTHRDFTKLRSTNFKTSSLFIAASHGKIDFSPCQRHMLPIVCLASTVTYFSSRNRLCDVTREGWKSYAKHVVD